MSVHEQKSPRRARRQVATAATGAVANAREGTDHQIKVALAAYFIAEKRGFEPGHELEDWLAAEAEIARAEPVVLTSIQLNRAGSAS